MICAEPVTERSQPKSRRTGMTRGTFVINRYTLRKADALLRARGECHALHATRPMRHCRGLPKSIQECALRVMRAFGIRRLSRARLARSVICLSSSWMTSCSLLITGLECIHEGRRCGLFGSSVGGVSLSVGFSSKFCKAATAAAFSAGRFFSTMPQQAHHAYASGIR